MTYAVTAQLGSLTPTGHCAECGARTPLRAEGRFCDADCARAARPRQTLRERVGGATCVYHACRSGAPICLDGRFCSSRCRAHQLRVDARRNEAIQGGLLARVPFERIMREVNAQVYEEPGEEMKLVMK